MRVFPQVFRLGMRDLSFVEDYCAPCAWNRGFGGQFVYGGQTYGPASLTLDINNRSVERMLEIAKDLGRHHFDTDRVLRIFPDRRIFVVLRR